jgi:hypothetical protein
MTIEPPRGLKNNLKQNFSGGYVTKKVFENSENGKNNLQKSFIFKSNFELC